MPGRLYVSHGEHGGDLRVAPWAGEAIPLPHRVVDPRTGEITGSGVRENRQAPVPDPGGAPRVYLCHAGWAESVANASRP